MKLMLFIFIFIQSFNALSQVNCDYTVQYTQVTAQVLESTQVLQQGISLVRGKNSPFGICGYFRFYFGKGSAQTYQRRAVGSNNYTVNYNLHQNVNANGVLKEQPDALTSAEWVELDAPDRLVTYSAPFFISIPSLTTQNYPPRGTYTDNLQVVIWTINQPGFVFDRITNLAVTIVVPSRLDISLVDEGAPFDVNSTSRIFNFGNLAQNQQRSGDLRVLSNTPYQLRISSQNGGLLRQGQNHSVAYSLSINNSPINLSSSTNSPVNFASGTGTSGNSGDRFNVVVRITENTSSKIAGLYEDTISITAIAN